MRSKPLQRIVVSLVLIVVMMLASTAAWTSVSPDDSAIGLARAIEQRLPRIFYLQNFENETAGNPADNWTVFPPGAGSVIVNGSTIDGDMGNYAKFVDNSTIDSVVASRSFTQQNGTIMFSFSVSLPYTTGVHTGLEVSVDDGGFNGSNIVFKDGAIWYYDGNKGLVALRSYYVANRWYRIKFIMNIPANVYNIHIDDHLEWTGAEFNGSCSQIHRIAVTEFSPSDAPGSLLPIGFIDDVEGRQGIIIPVDFPTIQAGVDAASPGDLVYVTSQRIYFESVYIPMEKSGIWLVGQDASTTIINGRFAETNPYRIALDGCSDVVVCGFTMNCSNENGTQVILWYSSGNVITHNIIINGLGDGIYIRGSNSDITDNVIQSNQVGISLDSGKDNLVMNNTIMGNMVGLQCGEEAVNNLIYANRFVANNQQALDYGTSNAWDDGYPYTSTPDSIAGGGNYWSDFSNCTDVYSGKYQDEEANCCWPSPDGICDQPYNINVNSVDHYPLFLIQNVTQVPKLNRANCALGVFDKSVQYTDNVIVTATTLRFVNISKATVYVDYTYAGVTTHRSISMTVSGNILTGTIPHQPYNTTVRYNVSVVASGVDWRGSSSNLSLNSTNYPIPFPYLVDDMTPPDFPKIPPFTITGGDENQTYTVTTTVTEPSDASGVDKVYASYQVNFTWWTAEMTKDGDDTYTAVIPRQWGGTTLNIKVTAVDKAGIPGAPTPSNSSTYVKRLAQLKVNSTDPIPYDPCDVDLGLLSGDQTYTGGFNITNIVQPNDDVLLWNIVTVEGGSWLRPLSITHGTLTGGQTIHVVVTVDTTNCSDPGLYVAKLSVNANGTVPQWAVILTFTVRDIIIDISWASSEWPNRVNVDSTQYVAFHAEWAINCVDATDGALKIFGNDTYEPVNTTGWATFSVSSSSPANITFGVEKVVFGNVTSFWQTALNRTIAWDRVQVVLTMDNNYVNVDSPADISWGGSYYELDQTPFNASTGYVFFNDSLTRDHVDEAWISTSSIVDYSYPNVTAYESNSVDVIWDEIEIIAGGVSRSQTPVGQPESVWFIGIYELENKVFKGANGMLFVNDGASDSALNWSGDTEIWRKDDLNYSTPGTRIFHVSKVFDNVHNLTKIKDNVGPLNITWGEPAPRPWWEAWWPTSEDVTTTEQPVQTVQPVQTQAANAYATWAVVIVVVVAMGLVLMLLILMSSGKKSKSKNGKKRAVLPTYSINTPSSKR
ncbi:MAG: NosD domain-containing protein [Candidatus Bathyarchaeia archaeon]